MALEKLVISWAPLLSMFTRIFQQTAWASQKYPSSIGPSIGKVSKISCSSKGTSFPKTRSSWTSSWAKCIKMFFTQPLTRKFCILGWLNTTWLCTNQVNNGPTTRSSKPSSSKQRRWSHPGAAQRASRRTKANTAWVWASKAAWSAKEGRATGSRVRRRSIWEPTHPSSTQRMEASTRVIFMELYIHGAPMLKDSWDRIHLHISQRSQWPRRFYTRELSQCSRMSSSKKYVVGIHILWPSQYMATSIHGASTKLANWVLDPKLQSSSGSQYWSEIWKISWSFRLEMSILSPSIKIKSCIAGAPRVRLAKMIYNIEIRHQRWNISRTTKFSKYPVVACIP